MWCLLREARAEREQMLKRTRGDSERAKEAKAKALRGCLASEGKTVLLAERALGEGRAEGEGATNADDTLSHGAGAVIV